MKETLSTNEVAERLLADENANWTWAGAQALAEYLEELESDMGEEIEFDRVAIRCDFSQYDSLVEWMREYWGDLDNAFDALDHCAEDGDDELEERIRDYINDHGTLIEFDGGIIVSSF
jgi:hypothetical protein